MHKGSLSKMMLWKYLLKLSYRGILTNISPDFSEMPLIVYWVHTRGNLLFFQYVGSSLIGGFMR
jgi:hypothetical protein